MTAVKDMGSRWTIRGRCASHARCVSLVLVALALVTAAPESVRAGLLDVAVDGDDLVFTWDTGTDDLLRGTTPDALAPWLTFVSSPLRVPNENLLRGENAFYRLASGSNMAYRVEKTFTVDIPGKPWGVPTTLPERHAYGSAFGLLTAWPSLVEVAWYVDPVLWPVDWKSATRVGPTLLGFDESLPVHGGVYLSFGATTTVTIVGSSDPAFAGLDATDVATEQYPSFGPVMPIPPDGRWQDSWQILCGERGSDWFDVDGDGLPDECGRDLDGDGWPDTGFWPGPPAPGRTTTVDLGITVSPEDGWFGPFSRVYNSPFIGMVFQGSEISAAPGDAWEILGSNFYHRPLFRIPRW